MKCPMCEKNWGITMGKYYHCFGCGEETMLTMTNEEWLRSATTEQLAEFLWNYTHNLITDWEHINNPMFRHMPLKNVLGNTCVIKESWLIWLKQPHTNEVKK